MTGEVERMGPDFNYVMVKFNSLVIALFWMYISEALIRIFCLMAMLGCFNKAKAAFSG